MFRREFSIRSASERCLLRLTRRLTGTPVCLRVNEDSRKSFRSAQKTGKARNPVQVRFNPLAPVSAPRPEEITALAPVPRDWVVQNFRPHETEVRGYLQARFPSLDTDDVVQESYLKLLRLRAAERIESARAYFFSVARNTALSVFRRQKIYSDVPVSELPPALLAADGVDGSEAAHSQQRLELVVAALDDLPARCREVMQLCLLEGRSTAEIARELGMAESTVRVQIVRGVQRCRAFMDARGEGAR